MNKKLTICFLLFVLLFSSISFADTTFNVMITDLTEVRDGVYGNTVGYIKKNTVKTIYGKRLDGNGRVWYRVWIDGKAGYIYGASVSKNLREVEEQSIKITQSLNVRRSVWGRKIGRLKRGSVKIVYGKRRDASGEIWYRVWYKGKAAYISSKYTIDNSKLIAITYDDGPSAQYTNYLLKQLKKEDVKATFFLLGCNIDNDTKHIILRMKRDGHEIGNHSFSHTYMPSQSDAFIRNDFGRTDNRIKAITGEKPKLVRYPYGASDDRIRNIVGKSEIYWSLDTKDWETRNRDQVKESILNNVKSGDIILLHDIHKTSVYGSLDAIKVLKKRGYKFVTVSELMRRKGIHMKQSGIYFSANE